MSKADKTYALRSRLERAKAMYTGDYRRISSTNNPQPCGVTTDGVCTTGVRGAAINTSAKYYYSERLIDLQLGQLECCRSRGITAACNCVGCLPSSSLPLA
jgi:hypothetical protein